MNAKKQVVTTTTTTLKTTTVEAETEAEAEEAEQEATVATTGVNNEEEKLSLDAGRSNEYSQVAPLIEDSIIAE